MPSASPLFGGRDIALNNKPSTDQFHQARLVLTLLYAGVLAITLVVSSGAIFSRFSTQIQQRLESRRFRMEQVAPGVFALVPSRDEVLQDLRNTMVLVDGMLVLLGGGAGYLLAGYTLRPIREAYEKQKNFVSDASHELRTPLTVLSSQLQNLRDEPSLSKATKQEVQDILAGVSRMSSLVTDLLTLSKTEQSGHVAEVISLAEFLHEQLELAQPLARERKVELLLDEEPEGEITTQPKLLALALSNILRNAIQYTDAKGKVVVSSSQLENARTITVKDTGMGIAPEEVGQVFTRFYRPEASRSRETGGSGLGLAIVQSSIEQLGGKVQLESEVGVGTSVVVILPNPSQSLH